MSACQETLDVNDHVIVETVGAFGFDLPYEAVVQGIKGDRVRVKPLMAALTAGSARSERTRKGPSVRARWVGRYAVKKCDAAFYADKIREAESASEGGQT